MKKFSTIIFGLLMGVCFIFTGCSSSNLAMPKDVQNVSSNGGFVVNVDNYMYFSNAFKSYKDLSTESDNKGSGVAQHSLQRAEVEINSANKPVLKLNENEKVDYQKVTNKIAGFETSNIFAVNNYLYFTTPNIQQNDKKGENFGDYQFDLISLYRVKLDGSGLKEVYTSETASAKFYLSGGENKKIFIYDEQKLLVVNAESGSTSTKTLISDVKQVVFPKTQDVELANIYYVVARDDAFTGDVLKKLNISNYETSEVSGYKVNNETLTLVSYDGTNLFYKRKKDSVEILYSNDFSKSGTSSQKIQKYEVSQFNNNSKIYVINSEEYDLNCFVYEYKNKIFVHDMEVGSDEGSEVLVSESSKIAFVDGTYVYYTTENGIFRVSALTKKIQQISDVKTFSQDYIDYDDFYVYFFAEVENSESKTKYLFRADLKSIQSDVIKTEVVGELLEEDIVEEEATEEVE